MGKVFSKAVRPVKNFNVENRAQRVLKSEKPRPAPRHPSTAAAFDNLAQEHPEIVDEQKKKHRKLDEYLKNIRVDSTGENPEIVAKSARHMPENRSKNTPSDYGFMEPDIIPDGRASLRQALDFISQHHLNPQEYPADKIASQYKLSVSEVQNILQHFQTLHMHIPKEMLQKNPKLLSSLDSDPVQRQSVSGMENLMKLGAGVSTVNGDSGQKKS
ncbi:hypothetical protein BaRGS_00017160 [Batillaria attramentaria]|uniref:Uncharacterized protein n=1 Tax=Batillaria attramentaria TaxID=370345 RepID=A0ABD0KWT5_9CAEN